MSFFEDDFYSTKVSKWSPAPKEPRYGMTRIGRSRTFPDWAVPALGGALVTLILIALIGGILLATRPSVSKETAVAAVAPKVGDTQQLISDAVVHAAEKVGPAVVSIISSRKDGADKQARGSGLGSGVVFQKVGDKVRIVTNNHVVDGSTQLEVVLSSGERKKGTLVGNDQISDLAVVEIDGAGVKQIAEFGDSDILKSGETVIAIGNPLGLGVAPTTTRGIISSPKRLIPVSLGKEGEFDWEMEVIQTDAAINSGNSGGALVNMEGKVIGINTLKVADYGVEGLGFAIPINQVKTVIDSLIQYHKVKRPYMGVVTQELQSFAGTDVLKLPSEVKTGIIVLDAIGPAKEAGLKTNDVITELDGKPIGSTLELRKYIYGSKAIGEKLNVTYYRGGKKATAVLTLAELKDK